MTVDVANVCVERGGHRCLGPVSYQVRPGRFTALLGPNGAGKTTLLDVMCRDSRPDSGSIQLAGRDLHLWKARDLARIRAVLPQHSDLRFGFSVLQVVGFGRLPFSESPSVSRERARGALGQVGLLPLEDRSWLSLSGGERQRVQLARVLAQTSGVPSPLLFLDEPTNHLDLRQRFEVLGLIRSLCDAGATVVAVLHDLDLAARFAQDAVLLLEGERVASGPIEQVLTAPHLQRAFGLDVDFHAVGTARIPVPRWQHPKEMTCG